MGNLPLSTWIAVGSLALVAGATITDLSSRRIPNILTFPGLLAAVSLHAAYDGWSGALFSLSGAVLAPCLLSFLHTRKGLGMGDIKLAAALGAFFGPPLGAVTILLSAVCGGVIALLWTLHYCGYFRNPLRRRAGTDDTGRPDPPELADAARLRIPYGLALSLGTVLAVVILAVTNRGDWLL